MRNQSPNSVNIPHVQNTQSVHSQHLHSVYNSYGRDNRQYDTKEPVDVVVFARDAENMRGSQNLKYSTVLSSRYTSHDSNLLRNLSSGRQDDFSSRSSKQQFSNSPKDEIKDVATTNTFQHYSPKKILESNSRHLGPSRVTCNNDNLKQSHFKPIHPALSINGNYPSREIFRGYNSELEDECRYGEKSIIQFNSDPYLPSVNDKYSSNQNFNLKSSRNAKLENSSMKRVRLAIPHYSEPDLNSVTNHTYKAIYNDISDESLRQCHINEDERQELRGRNDVQSLQYEMSPRRRPTGFGSRLLPQVPEQSAIESGFDDPSIYRNSVSGNDYQCDEELEIQNKNDRTHSNCEQDDNSENQVQIQSSSNPPTYLKRRRTAVFGLSPTSGLNIGAVM